MNTEYSVEEMRARLGFVISDREPRILTWESGGCHPASIAECALWDALAERIEAGEAKALGTCPKHGVEYVGECSGCAMTLPEKDFTHPPAQAAQVDPTAKPRTLADFVNAPDAERAQIGQQVAARVDEMVAELVAQNKVVYQVRHRSVQEGWSEWTEATKGHFDAVNAAIASGACSQTRTIQTEQSRAVPDARIVDLAERLVASGPKAAHVSASECHEISEFILSLAAPPIDAPDSKP